MSQIRLDDIKKWLAKQLDTDADRIVPQANIMDDFGADSLEMVELQMEIENKFDIQFSIEEENLFSNETTIDKIVQLINKKLTEKENKNLE